MKARILILSLVLLAACQPVEIDYDYQKTLSENTPQAGEGYTMTLQATKGIDTKALSLDGTKLNAYWADGEKVGVYVNGTRCGQLLVTPEVDTTKATLSGSVSTAIKADDVIVLLYPDREDITEGTKWDYTGQAGAAPAGDLAARFDYATATLSVSSIEGTTVHTTTSSVAFQHEQSIYRFDFKVNDALKDVKWFTVSSNRNLLVTSRSYNNGWGSNHGDLTVTLAGNGATSPYVSLRNENTTQVDTYSFLVVGGDDALYAGNKEIPADKLGNGKFLAPGVTLTKTNLHNPTGFIYDPNDVL